MWQVSYKRSTLHSRKANNVSLSRPPSFSGASLKGIIGASARMGPSKEELETETPLEEEEVFLFMFMLKKKENEITVRKVRLQEKEMGRKLWRKSL